MKTKITRKDLEKIHNVACQNWKSKIKKYAEANPFSDEIEFTKEQIQEMLTASTEEQLPIVKEVFNVVETFESIKTLEDACKVLGEDDEQVKTLRVLQSVIGLDRKVVSLQELTVITKALNDGWTPDFDNHNEYKYYLWFYLGKKFRLNDCDCYFSYSCAPASLVHKSREIALYSAKQFENIWKDCLN